MRLRTALTALVAIPLLFGAFPPRSLAAEDPNVVKVRASADGVLATLAAGDAQALARLAAQDDPDPWLVADELFARGRLDAARAFAGAFAKTEPRPDVERLLAYLDALDGKADEPALRARLTKANEALSARRFADAVAATDPGPPDPLDGVVALRLACARGYALANVSRLAEAVPLLVAVAQQADRLGWLSRAVAIYQSAAGMATSAAEFALARDVCTRALAVCERRGASSTHKKAEFRGLLGDALNGLDEPAGAIEMYTQALATFEALGSADWIAFVLMGRGHARANQGDHAAALEDLTRALPRFEATGDRQRMADTLLAIGNMHEATGHAAEGRAAYERALPLFEQLGDQVGLAGAVINLGLLERKAGSRDRAIALLERGMGLAQAAHEAEFEANALAGLIEDHLARGEVERTIAGAEHLVELAESIKAPHRAGWALWQVGQLQFRRREWPEAAAAFSRAIPYFEAAGSRSDAVEARMLRAYALGLAGDWGPARTTGERELTDAKARGEHKLVGEMEWMLASERSAGGDSPAARAGFERAREAFLAAGDPARAAEMLQEVATVHSLAGDVPMALATFDEALRASEAAGDQPAFATTLNKMGHLYLERGELTKALPLFERALGIYQGLGDRYGEAGVLHSLGIAQAYRGEFAKALATKERALALHLAVGDKIGAAQSLCNIGCVYADLGDRERAIQWYRRALAAQEQVGDQASQATTLGNLGDMHVARDEPEEAARCYERALALRVQIGREPGIAVARQGQATLAEHRKDWAAALKVYEEILPVLEAHGDKLRAVSVLESMAGVHDHLGDTTKALQLLDRAGRAAERLGAVSEQVSVLGATARLRLKAGDAARAMDAAHRAVLLLKTVVGGLGEEQGAVARGRYSELFATGLSAAAKAADPDEAVFFLESGRAGSLLEALGARSALRWASLPEGLRVAEREARAAEAAALVAYRKVADGGDLAVGRARKADLDAARGKVADAIERIQREEKKAQLWYPVATPAEDLRELLAPEEALVLYGLAEEGDAYAVVLTRSAARTVALGRTSAVAEACDALQADHPGGDPVAALERLGKLLVTPLGLPPEAKRVLVSPEGPLSYVPLAALVPDREIVYAASGSTYAELIGRRTLSGRQVLALADPDYAAEFEPAALSLYALDQRGAGSATRGRTLAPLPGTRVEAEALADVKRFGAEASEAGLRDALTKHPGRWRSVHFACHGLVDPERPTLSSLVLTPDADNDGFLTALEVLRMEIPADLVVLSACETGRGKIVTGEGIVGLTRAFMYAGAPRVICSLWKVDDEATRALMTKFYELWNPKDGKPGIPTAAALRKAQEFVKSHEKWKHPYYWAAWVLWGLPE